MKTIELLKRLADNNIQISVKQGKLDINAPKGKMTSEFLALLKEHKNTLLDYLEQSQVKRSGIPRANKSNPLLLSFQQKRLWFIDQVDPESAHYNITGVVEIEGDFQVDIAEKAFQSIVERHQVLRSVFVEEKSDSHSLNQTEEPVQKILTGYQFKISVFKVPEDSKEKKKKLNELINQEQNRPFDLSSDLMLRVKYIHLSRKTGILILSMHHVASDGWSMNVLVEEFAELYNALKNNREALIEPLLCQYYDFAQWQRQLEGNENFKCQLDYWNNKLAGIPEIHGLPTDYSRPKKQSFDGQKLSFNCHPELQKKLTQLCSRHNISYFMLVHAAFSLMLSRLSNSNDIVVGTPVANRQEPEVEKLIGFFVNTLVLRVNIDESLNLTQFLDSIKSTNLEAQENQAVPFELIVEKINPRRNLSYGPLVQILLNMNSNAEVMPRLEGCQLRQHISNKVTAKFELVLNIIDDDGSRRFDFEYNPKIFSSQTINTFSLCLIHIFEEMVKDSARTLVEYSILDDAQKQNALMHVSQVDAPQSDQCFHRLFEKQVACHSNKVAIDDGQNKLSFGELNARANQIAYKLIEQNISSDTIVGLHMGRSCDMLIALFGILKAGAAYLPLDPQHPYQRLHQIIDDSGLALVITDNNSHEFNEENVSVYQYDELALSNVGQVVNPDVAEINSHSMAYVIYTSGSTGKPKGVVIEHHSLVNLALNIESFSFSQQGAWGWVAPFVFDASLQGLCQLVRGQTLRIINESEKLDKEMMQRLLSNESIALLDCTPSLVEVWFEMELDSVLPDLLIGGEAITKELWQKLVTWQATYSRKAVNVYGPTECTVDSTYALIKGEQPTIGTPLKNYQLLILDPQQRLMPPGMVGELYIGGRGLAREYLNNPQQTEANFAVKKVDEQVMARLYRTKDLVRQLPCGNLIFEGRIDEQIKIRGYRVELGEVEHWLKAHPRVKSAVAAVAKEDSNRLLGYVELTAEDAVEKSNAKVTSSDSIARDIRNCLQSQLPEYMIPDSILVVAAFSLNSNGKIDKTRLPHIDDSSKPEGALLPSVSEEKVLANIWSELLNRPVESITIASNFFELGGHSLLAVRLMNQIRHQLGLEVSIHKIFEYPELGELAQCLGRASAQSEQRKLPKIVCQCKPQKDLKIASYAQQRIWFIDQLDAGSVHYNMPGVFEVCGEFNIDTAQQVFYEIILRHEPLRSSFHSDSTSRNHGPLVMIKEKFDFSLRLEDLRGFSSEERNKEMKRLIKANARQSFDLSSDLLIRASYLLLEKNKGIMLFNLHHIAADGWSIGVLVDEFVTRYTALTRGENSTIKPLTVHYSDYANWQRNCSGEELLQQQLCYWKTQLSNLPQVHSIPLDFERPEFSTFRGAHYQYQLNNELYKKLKNLAVNYEVTFFMILQAALSWVLSRYSDNNDIVVGTPVANRREGELESLIGVFINMLVLRTNCSGKQSFLELLRQVRKVNLDAQANQDIPFELLVDELNPVRDTSLSPLFQVLLSLNNNPIVPLSLDGISFKPIDETEVTAKFDLSLHVHESDSCEFTFEYSVDLFKESTIKRIGDAVNKLLEQIVLDPERDLSTTKFMSDEELELLIENLNQTNTNFPSTRCVHELFELQVNKTPNNVAVVCENEILTYDALNKRANKVAHQLLRQGIEPDEFVGICAERSLDLMVGILAILKSGGAYLPLDPSYPEERLRYMLENSNVKILLSQQKITKKFEFGDVACITLDEESIWQHSSDANIPKESIGLQPNHLAYIIYTSGSTGQPKGVMVEHKNETNLLYWYQKEYEIRESDRVLILSAIGFDLTQKNFFAPLMVGGSVEFATSRYFDVNEIIRFVARRSITLTNCAPSLFYPLIEENSDISQLDSLRCVLFGGEAIAFDRLQPWINRVGNKVDIINMYGPTECTDIACAHRVNINQTLRGAPIGSANANVQLYVLDEYMQLAPFGVAGELCISGHGVSRGYLNQQDLNTAKFISNPFKVRGSERLYRTGDMVKWNSNSELEFIGRIDNQIKVRGFRVELGEIESALASFEFVQQAAVVYNSESQKIHAYLVGANESIIVSYISSRIREHLPEYMVPSSFTVVSELPLTPHGKIDKSALPSPSMSPLEKAIVAPATEMEQLLHDVWRKILDLEHPICTESNFFELGGNSLLLTQMIHLLAKKRKIQLAVRTVFSAPTIRKLAKLIDGSEFKNDYPPILPTTIDQRHLASYAQNRVWFMDQVRTDSSEHNMAVAVRITGRFSVSIFEKAVQFAIEKHDILRTRFDCVDGQVFQIVEKQLQYKANYVDLAQLSNSEKEHQVAQLSLKQDKKQFVLNQPPLFSILILKVAKDEYELRFNQHHIISDGWSQQLLFDELLSNYLSLTKDDSTLAYEGEEEKQLAYVDYAHWQSQWLKDKQASHQRQFWKEYLDGCTNQYSLSFQKNGGTLDGEQNHDQLIIPGCQRDKLKAIAQQRQGTLFNILHAAFAILLCRTSGHNDLNIGIPVTGRHIFGTENMLGIFLNNLPVRHQINLSQVFSDFLRTQIENIESVLSNQDIPFEEIVELSGVERIAESTPLFQVFFNMLNLPEGQVDYDELDFDIEQKSVADVGSKFNLTFYIMDDTDELRINCHFNNQYFSRKHVSIFLSQYAYLLEQITENIQQSIGSYSLNVKSNWIDYAKPITKFSSDSVVIKFFKQVDIQPQALAIVDEAGEWSYAQLLNASQVVSRQLRAEQVGGGSRVMILAQREASLIPAILGVLQAGASYAIVTAETPIERILQQLSLIDATTILVCGTTNEFNNQLVQAISAERMLIEVSNRLEAYEESDSQMHLEDVDIDLNAEACITFTSGSTGLPKAVAGSHLGLSGYLDWLPEAIGLESGERFSLLSGLAHDPLQRDIFGALCTGGTIVIPDRQSYAQLDFEAWVDVAKPSILHITPTMAEVICIKSPMSLDNVKVVFLTGEVLRRDTLEKLRQNNPNTKILNCFGATETHRAATYFDALDFNSEDVIVPTAIHTPDTRLRLLNSQGGDCGFGEIGQIATESHHLALGYLKDSGRSENFKSLGGGLRQYETGDLGVTLDAQSIHCLGRADDQVNIRGYRIELGEVEYQLGVLDEVESATTRVFDGNIIVAYVCLTPQLTNAALVGDDLLEKLRNKLPEYMCPSHIEVLNKMPLTSNGKINKNSLPSISRLKSDRQLIPLVGSVEKSLAETWMALLNLDKDCSIGANDNFFDLGGHSLLLVRLISDIKNQYGVTIELRFVFEAKNLRIIAQKISSNLKQKETADFLSSANEDEIEEMEF